MRRKILITGGAGFIGSHLCENLLNNGDEVFCFDNLSTGKLDNISHLKNRMTFIKGDANSFADLESIFKSNKLSGVFHHAAIVGVRRTIESPIDVLNDVESARNILNLSLKYNKPKVVFASSSEVYGEPIEIPEAESGHVNPQMPYAVTKLYCEKLMESYWGKYKLPTCSLRFFNVYGPRQESSDYGFVIGIFIKRVLAGLQPLIYGDGTQTRDFVYINDNIAATVKALESQKTNGEVINIGTGRPTTVLDLAERIIDVCGRKKLGVKFIKSRDDVKHRFPDISKMRNLLDFRPKYSLDEGLKKTIDWYKKEL